MARPHAPAPSAARAPNAIAYLAPNCCEIQPTIGPPIGVLPRNSIACSASTRPRISGADLICTIAVDATRNEMLAIPSKIPHGYANHWLGANVIIDIATP